MANTFSQIYNLFLLFNIANLLFQMNTKKNCINISQGWCNTANPKCLLFIVCQIMHMSL